MRVFLQNPRTPAARCTVLVGLAVSAGASAVHAATSTDVDDPFRVASPLTFVITPGVYLPRLGGTIEFGTSPLARDIFVETELDLNAQETVFNAELEIRHDTDAWEFFLGGFDISGDGTGTFVGAADFGAVELRDGDSFTTEFNYTTIAADFAPVGWTLAQSERGYLRFLPHVGLRYLGIEHRISEVGGEQSTVDESFLFVYGGAGARLRFDLPADAPVLYGLEAFAYFSAGVSLDSDPGWMWQVRGGLNFDFTPNVGLQVGYRLFEPDVEKDSLHFSTGTQGLFFGVRAVF